MTDFALFRNSSCFFKSSEYWQLQNWCSFWPFAVAVKCNQLLGYNYMEPRQNFLQFLIFHYLKMPAENILFTWKVLFVCFWAFGPVWLGRGEVTKTCIELGRTFKFFISCFILSGALKCFCLFVCFCFLQWKIRSRKFRFITALTFLRKREIVKTISPSKMHIKEDLALSQSLQRWAIKLIVEILVEVMVNELCCFPLPAWEGAVTYFIFFAIKGGNFVEYWNMLSSSWVTYSLVLQCWFCGVFVFLFHRREPAFALQAVILDVGLR